VELPKRRANYQPVPKKIRSCGDCGAPFRASNGNHRFCSNCAADRQAAHVRARQAQSQKIRTAKARAARNCKWCGRSGLPGRSPYCSSLCREAGRLYSTRKTPIAEKWADRDGTVAAIVAKFQQPAYRRCEWCAVRILVRRQYCSEECMRLALGHRRTSSAVYIRECEGCGELKVGRSKRWRFCSKACRRVRPVTTKTRHCIYERDGWACQICGDQTDPSDFEEVLGSDGRVTIVVGYTYPSLDHIVPKSLGGPDTVENLRTAHHGCNSDRGIGEDDEQMAWAI